MFAQGRAFVRTAENPAPLQFGHDLAERYDKRAISADTLPVLRPSRGYAIGAVLAFALTSLAVSTRVGRDLLSMLTAMFNPLPSIALLPIALL
jgi:ABC-type nitrate/sulfonate/bicarbonate transport system permease component